MAEPEANPCRFGRTSRLAWILCALVCAGALVDLGLAWQQFVGNVSSLKRMTDLLSGILPIIFAVVAALIISRQPRNAVGWLLMTPAVTFALVMRVDAYLGSFATAPAPTTVHLVMVWFQGWSWLLLIFPLALILLLFPTGRPPSLGWRWVQVYALGVFVSFILISTFSQDLQGSEAWKLPNPIGVIPNDLANSPYVVTPWIASFGLLIVLCAASLFVRYRRAPTVQRLQLKWLLWASAAFSVIYVPLLALESGDGGWASDLANFLLIFSTTLFPIAIAIAILRHRLWDIDVIIRKTLTYSLLTATLAVIFFGSVVLLQQVVGRLAGIADSPFVVVLSTLAIAALFTPLRRLIQNIIDRRFYRQTYEGARILERFAATTLNEVEVEQLAAHLISAVDEALKPQTVSLWLIEGKEAVRL